MDLSVDASLEVSSMETTFTPMQMEGVSDLLPELQLAEKKRLLIDQQINRGGLSDSGGAIQGGCSLDDHSLQDDMQLRSAQSSCIQAVCQCKLAQLDLLRLSGRLGELEK